MGCPEILLLITILQLSTAFPGNARTQSPVSPVLHYTLCIDSTDLSGYTVLLRVSHAPHQFHLAMATHHEYDDRFWRFVTGFRVTAPASFSREDSAFWTINTPRDEVIISYRIQLPPPAPFHFSHRPFLARYGGLVGDLHTFMYLVEDPHAACRLILQLPAGWEAASGLDPAASPAPTTAASPPPTTVELLAASAIQLLDAPILVGHLHSWRFTVAGVPHQIAYLPATPTLQFDTAALVANIKKIVTTTKAIFGGFPYRHYSFLLEDASAGALEHHNSVTIALLPDDIAKGVQTYYPQIAHEYFHTWNLLSIHPSGYTELNYGTQQRSPGLWFAEGVTMLYADLICRKSGLHVGDSTRIAHLAKLITRYYSDTGNAVLLPGLVSLASNVQPGPLGDYDASTHLQGELLGTCLDMLIRDATDGRQNIDDMMRIIYRRFGGPFSQPYRDSDIETAAAESCQCDEAHTFFQNYLYHPNPIDFAPSLARLGLRLQHDQPPATDPQGRPLPDTRIYSWILRDDTSLRIGITNPNSCWAHAGLHTGDIITAIDGRPIHGRQDFQAALQKLHIGDTVAIDTKKEAAATATPHTIYITGYAKPVITITKDPAASPKQRRLLQQWLDAN